MASKGGELLKKGQRAKKEGDWLNAVRYFKQAERWGKENREPSLAFDAGIQVKNCASKLSPEEFQKAITYSSIQRQAVDGGTRGCSEGGEGVDASRGPKSTKALKTGQAREALHGARWAHLKTLAMKYCQKTQEGVDGMGYDDLVDLLVRNMVKTPSLLFEIPTELAQLRAQWEEDERSRPPPDETRTWDYCEYRWAGDY